MTPKEALNWCEQFIDNLVKVDVDTKRRTLGLQAMQTIKSALERQIPKKVEVYDDDCRADCPVCGYTFENNVNDWGCKYCQDCGQALDWSDTE